MSKALEAHLEQNELSDSIDKASAAEVINAIDKVLFSLSQERGKTVITHRNHKGIIRANTFNDYLFQRYGFKIELLDALIFEKVTWVNSINGHGQDKVIEALNALKVSIESKGSLDVGDRLLGVSR